MDGWSLIHNLHSLDLLEANNLMPIDLLSVKGQRSANGWGAEVSEYLDEDNKVKLGCSFVFNQR